MLRKIRNPAALATALIVLGAAQRAELEEDAVRVVVTVPRPGEIVRSRIDVAPLAGVAHAGERPAVFEVMVVIDVSGSTEYPSGMDVNRNGELGVQSSALIPALPQIKNTDPGDSILAAEVQAARALLQALDPARVRVGVVSFSGEYREDGRRQHLGESSEADARVEQVLTSDYERVRAKLDALALRGSHGGTNLEAGIKLGLRELVGLEGSQSTASPHAKKVILLLTDGKPSLPFGAANVEDEGDTEAAILAAELAQQAGAMINVYGLGEFAIDYPLAATRVASVTGGSYTPVRRPGDIVLLLSGVSFANIDAVVAVNLTLGEIASTHDIDLAPDGSFRGFVPVQPGKNRIRISALASDGSRGSTELTITYRPQELSDAELAGERDRIQKRNRDLELLMERRRQQAFREAERERMIEIEVEPPQRNDEERP